MKTAILIVTYLKDRPYLELNLRSIQKFARGFSSVNVLVPNEEMAGFKDLASKFPITLMYYFRDCPETHWHLRHQVEKCNADRWCPDDDFVLHTDSDCMFTEPVTPEDYFVGNRPVMLYESYANLKEQTPWQAIVSGVLKRPVAFEFMRRHPQVNPKGVYPALRSHITALHGQEFDEYVMAQRPSFPWGFTEHNVIGAFAFNDPLWHDKYHWHYVSKAGVPKEKLIQFWSHSLIDQPQNISHGGRFTPKEYAERILA